VVLVSVLFGYFTSLNQALVGAMAGTGWARGGRQVQPGVLRGIVLAWAFGPVSGLAVGYVAALLVRAAGAA
jgi:PiT family inorganic phosphate transporter